MIGSCWATGTWDDDAWATGSWEDAEEAPETPYVGKYAAEHAMALAELTSAVNFASEHTAALAALGDAGR